MIIGKERIEDHKNKRVIQARAEIESNLNKENALRYSKKVCKDIKITSIVHSNLDVELDISSITTVSEKVYKSALSTIKKKAKKEKLEKEFYKELSKNQQKELSALRNKIEKDDVPSCKL